MSSEFEKGRRFLKKAAILSLAISILLLIFGIASSTRIFINGVEFTKKIIIPGIGGSNSYETEMIMNSTMGIIYILFILLFLPAISILDSCNLKKTYKNLNNNLKVCEQSILNIYQVLQKVKAKMFSSRIIGLFFSLLFFILAYCSSALSNEQLFMQNRNLLWSMLLLFTFNPGVILAIISFQFLFGNELRRMKKSSKAAEQRRARQEEINLLNKQECKSLIAQCGMAFFTKYYYELQKMNDMDLVDIITENYPYAAKMSRIKAAKEIFSKKLDKLVLENIIESVDSQISGEVANLARSILNMELKKL